MADERGNSPASTVDKVLQWTGSQVQTIDGTPRPEIPVYEEGTWTPTLTGEDTAGDYDLGSTGFSCYTVTGNRVTLDLYLRINAINTPGSGRLNINGVPFDKIADTYPIGALRPYDMDLPAGIIGVNLAFDATISSNTLILQASQDNDITVNLDVSSLSVGTVIAGQIRYLKA